MNHLMDACLTLEELPLTAGVDCLSGYFYPSVTVRERAVMARRAKTTPHIVLRSANSVVYVRREDRTIGVAPVGASNRVMLATRWIGLVAVQGAPGVRSRRAVVVPLHGSFGEFFSYLVLSCLDGVMTFYPFV